MPNVCIETDSPECEVLCEACGKRLVLGSDWVKLVDGKIVCRTCCSAITDPLNEDELAAWWDENDDYGYDEDELDEEVWPDTPDDGEPLGTDD